jgi:glycine/D-amino acid oxidase-like deaminating enzyme
MDSKQPKKIQQIVLATDGSSEQLGRLLGEAKLTQWHEDQLILVAIAARPVEAHIYEPQFFRKSISPDEFEAMKQRLGQCCEQLSTEGYQATTHVIYREDFREVQQALQALSPDLVVTHRSLARPIPWRWLSSPDHSFLIDASPCPVLVV